MLDLHNTKRGLHGATDVHWNNTLFDYAAAYASKYDCSGVLTHSGGLYGENLAIGYSTDGAMEAWYDEGNNFPYGTESEYNHFTQVIWNGSTSIGCSPKYCNSVWGTYIICSYFPAGNVIGYESENVFPPI
ncbi:CAP domain-containing protein [Scheffersomyces coipomensis]|uniref:CAP domain-containing protein n=1 Tax=Scheffersomyces coipomensis TaxID=1788519 RepID=UPI00315D5A99